MYQQFFGLTDEPFPKDIKTSDLFVSPAHKELFKRFEHIKEKDEHLDLADVLKEISDFGIQDSVTGSGSIVGHASGGIALSTHVIGEAGPEAMIPLHNGADTIKIMDQKLDSLLQATPIVNVAVYIGNEQLDTRIKVVANNEMYKRQRRNITGQVYYKRPE